MSLTDVMDDVDYTLKNFNENEAMIEQPLWMTESHFVYHLQRSTENGQLAFLKDTQGEPLCSPRSLRLLSLYHIVVKPSRMKILKGRQVPPDLYPLLLTEAIFQRSLQTVSYLVSTWPHPQLHVHQVLPPEDLESFQQLTEPFDTSLSVGMSLCDAFIAGLLNTKTSLSKLQLISFAGFKEDRKLCRELVRLPVLWIKPDHRQPDFIHSLLNQDMGVSEEDVERYLNRITSIYSNVDGYVRHGHDIGPITVDLDCKVTLDDVPIGLALQFKTPFRFRCPRVWMDPVTEFAVPLTVLHTVLEPQAITHLEVEDPDLCKIPSRWEDLKTILPHLTSLTALSLPNTLHVDLLPDVFQQLGHTLQGLKMLSRVNLSSCTVRDHLGQVLQAVGQPLTYLSLRDCRMTQVDVQALLEWPKVTGLKELNLSRNNLQTAVPQLLGLLHKMAANVVCFSISYSSLPPPDLHEVSKKCTECQRLKVLGLQSFTPPLPADLNAIIQNCSKITSLQRCVVFPESYAFPGRQISQRAANRASVGLLCTDLLMDLGRPDIQLA